MANCWGWGLLSCQIPWGGDEKRGQMRRPPSGLQHFSLIAQSNSAILSILMCDFLFQWTSKYERMFFKQYQEKFDSITKKHWFTSIAPILLHNSVSFQLSAKEQKIIYANLYLNKIIDGDSQTSPFPIFPEGGGTSVHRLTYWQLKWTLVLYDEPFTHHFDLLRSSFP